MAVAVPKLRLVEALSLLTGLDQIAIQQAIAFLLRIKAVEHIDGELRVGSRHLHLGKDSKNVLKHHSNWRVQSLKPVEVGGSNKIFSKLEHWVDSALP